MRYQVERDSKKSEKAGSTRYQEVRDTRKHRVREHKILDTISTNYLPRSTKYKEVRDTNKYEIPRRARCTRMGDIPGSHMKDHIKVIAVGVLRYSIFFHGGYFWLSNKIEAAM